MMRANTRVIRAATAAAHRALQHVRCTSVLNGATTHQRAHGAAVVSQQQQHQRAHGAAVVSQQQQRQRQQHQSMLPIAASFAAAAAVMTASLNTTACDAAVESESERSGYSVNPIQNVTALLRLYEEIDKNMDVFTNRMLADLKQRVDKEKAENNGKLKVPPEQLALNMSIEFESTLEKVQDAVFRNNYVSKAQVTDAMQRLIARELPGGAADGTITPAEAEAISNFVSRLGRMRWKVTGSRKPLLPTQHKALVKDDKPSIELAVVLRVMEELIPSLTRELEAIAKDLDAAAADGSAEVTAAERRQRISSAYIRRSGELTAELCARHSIDMRAFQQALIYYHDDPTFEQALARLSAEQQQTLADLGL